MASKYQYRCPMVGCEHSFNAGVPLSDFPTCNGTNGSHHKLMDFIEDESIGVPDHVLARFPKGKNKKRLAEGGNWV